MQSYLHVLLCAHGLSKVVKHIVLIHKHIVKCVLCPWRRSEFSIILRLYHLEYVCNQGLQQKYKYKNFPSGQGLYVTLGPSKAASFVSLGRYIPKYFILSIAMVNGIVSLISLSVFSLLVYRNARDLGWMPQPKDKDWLNGYKNKIPTYVVYKRPTSKQGTHTDWKWRAGKRFSMQIGTKRKQE